jgi:hypothetical protein
MSKGTTFLLALTTEGDEGAARVVLTGIVDVLTNYPNVISVEVIDDDEIFLNDLEDDDDLADFFSDIDIEDDE